MAGMWRIDPFAQPLQAVADPEGRCALPEDMAHCHGWETQHADGIAECLGHCDCDAPRSGRHTHVDLCERDVNYMYSYLCDRCQ